MTDIATIDWFGRWGTSVFCENTAIFKLKYYCRRKSMQFKEGKPKISC